MLDGLLCLNGTALRRARRQIEYEARAALVLDEPKTEGQLRVLALDPELVWLTHTDEPWRPGHEA